jgi:hypothetical protein
MLGLAIEEPGIGGVEIPEGLLKWDKGQLSEPARLRGVSELCQVFCELHVAE